MDDLKLTVEQYQDAIKNALSFREIEVLQFLYAFPNSTASAKELSELISPSNPAPIVASGLIGKIGKAIATHLDVTPWYYYNGKNNTPAYFSIVGPYYASEGKINNERPGWEMKENLRKALQNLKLVEQEKGDIFFVEKLPTEEQFEQQQFFKEGKATQVYVKSL